MSDTANELQLSQQWADLDVLERVLETDDFIVFINKSECCDYKTSDKYDAKPPTDKAKYARLISEASNVENSPHIFLSRHDKIGFKRLICEGIARTLENEYSAAKAAYEAAKAYLERRQNEQSREWYLSAAAITTGALLLVLAVVALVCNLNQVELMAGLGAYLVYVELGFVGALLSIVFRMGKTSFDFGAKQRLHYWEACMRVIVGGIAAMVAVFAVKAKLLFGGLVNPDNEVMFLMFLSVAAGALEKWIPSLIASVGKHKISTSSGEEKK
ncbi:hypothetical protein [Massilia alkalitolerans]|uniref:hypothetical protein n=1 Tax=Massilia alkalitolerans TaxID=286638 RepID=UPI00047F2730|nr:hypothetical protein [Massilia alkalitolerans]